MPRTGGGGGGSACIWGGKSRPNVHARPPRMFSPFRTGTRLGACLHRRYWGDAGIRHTTGSESTAARAHSCNSLPICRDGFLKCAMATSGVL